MAENEEKDEAKVAAGVKGGNARAQALTRDQRRAIARQAADARWANEGKTPVPVIAYGSDDSTLKIGSIEIPCYVLSDNRRVLAMSGMLKALTIAEGSSGQAGGNRLAKFVSGRRLSNFVSSDLLGMTADPIRFRSPRGGTPGYGFEATVLADICEAVLAAHDAGMLDPRSEHIAIQAKILIRGFARVGINALVDEATGYQDARARDALAQILEQFIATELQKWVRTFQPEFYKEMFRLRGWPYSPLSNNRAAVVGNLTNNIVYQRLAPGVLEELKRTTPRDEKGRHTTQLHRRLTQDIGHPRLREHLAAVTALMKISDTWQGFMHSLDIAFPKFGTTGMLPFRMNTK
ncbi:MAG: hypothetical protein QOK37_1358 [Thermoanaerobaculia bacterium]|jgi:hypothetical protein|nr:hypothetical protein [Thermoanaerobaculia bacterium]